MSACPCGGRIAGIRSAISSGSHEKLGSGRIPVSVDCACQKVRNRLHVLLAELADHLRLSRQTINALETGKYDPSLPLAFKIAHLFGKPIEEIFQSDPELEW